MTWVPAVNLSLGPASQVFVNLESMVRLHTWLLDPLSNIQESCRRHAIVEKDEQIKAPVSPVNTAELAPELVPVEVGFGVKGPEEES